MSEPAQHHAINYIEFTTTDIAKTKAFYERVFSWNFQDYGPDYISFDREHAGIDGGFRKGEPSQAQSDTAPLIILYSQDLKATQDAISRRAVPRRAYFRVSRRQAIPFLRRTGQRAGGWSSRSTQTIHANEMPRGHSASGHSV